MERIPLIAACCFALGITQLSATDPSQKPPEHPDKKPEQVRPKNDEAESLKKTIRALSPEQKQRIAENLKAWKQLTAEQKEALRHREQLQRKQASDEVANVTAGLPDDQRDLFLQRYQEERRKLQASLRQEMEARRKAELSDLLQRLKQEMESTSAKPTPAPAAAP
jgi:hypothetical protein